MFHGINKLYFVIRIFQRLMNGCFSRKFFLSSEKFFLKHDERNRGNIDLLKFPTFNKDKNDKKLFL
jgi:hypothetical protein